MVNRLENVSFFGGPGLGESASPTWLDGNPKLDKQSVRTCYSEKSSQPRDDTMMNFVVGILAAKMHSEMAQMSNLTAISCIAEDSCIMIIFITIKLRFSWN